MVQGMKKMPKGSIGGGSNKTKRKQSKTQHVKKQNLTKGRKFFSTKTTHKVYAAKRDAQTSKMINDKNFVEVSARAMSAHETFFLGDIRERGTKKADEKNKKRSVLEGKGTKLNDRLKEKLKRMENGAHS